MDRCDALLLVSFGGPEGPDDVLPFLRNVTRGRGIPDERLAAVGEHYRRFGGVSPINAQCRALIEAVEADFAAHDVRLPVYWGNRNWEPYLADTMRAMAADGVRVAAAFVTAAYSSYSSCRQYLDDIAGAVAAVPGAPRIDKLRPYFDHPGFVTAVADRVRAALADLPAEARERARLVFTAHSVPLTMARASGRFGDAYQAQLAEAGRLVVAELGEDRGWDLVYQSRSGRPDQRWLEPDVCDHLAELHAKDIDTVVIVPLGFVSDHMEVKFDLDVEAAEAARRLGMTMVRARTAGTHPRFVAMVRELLAERYAGAPVRSLGDLSPCPHDCPAGCCQPVPG